MTWTTDTPTQPGWYWFKPSSQWLFDGLTEILLVFKNDGDVMEIPHNCLFIFDPDNNTDVVAVDNLPGHWAGPIPAPEG